MKVELIKKNVLIFLILVLGFYLRLTNIDFKNTIIIMTSNVGTKDIKEIGSFGFSDASGKDKYDSLKDTVEDAMKKLFNPEFLNRIDDSIVLKKIKWIF